MSVFVNNLDDFISPSQACINPLVLKKGIEGTSKNSSIKISIENDMSMSEFDVNKNSNAQKTVASVISNTNTVSVSLSDCLACRLK